MRDALAIDALHGGPGHRRAIGIVGAEVVILAGERYREGLVPFLERLTGMHVFDPTVFVISQVPSEVHWPQVIGITVTALVLTVLATIDPAVRGAATEPAEALRYE